MWSSEAGSHRCDGPSGEATFGRLTNTCASDAPSAFASTGQTAERDSCCCGPTRT
jgi:hypothetical protein